MYQYFTQLQLTRSTFCIHPFQCYTITQDIGHVSLHIYCVPGLCLYVGGKICTHINDQCVQVNFMILAMAFLNKRWEYFMPQNHNMYMYNMNSWFHSDAKLHLVTVVPFSQSHSYFMKLQPIISLHRLPTISLLLGVFGKFSHQGVTIVYIPPTDYQNRAIAMYVFPCV